jgi:hypothetical protein
MERNLSYWEHRLHNIEENVLTETDPNILRLELVNYVECLLQAAMSLEVEEYTYSLN